MAGKGNILSTYDDLGLEGKKIGDKVVKNGVVGGMEKKTDNKGEKDGKQK